MNVRIFFHAISLRRFNQNSICFRKQHLGIDASQANKPLSIRPIADCTKTFDIGIIGAGIVGMATAREIMRRHPSFRVVVFEKDVDVGCQQTGHNSGVIHSGVYYEPGSLRAQLCTAGNRLMYAFCKEHNIHHHQCGKLIVAVDDTEVPRLQTIFENGKKNGVSGISWINETGIRDIEPHCHGVAAVHCPTTGIVNYKQVTDALADDFISRGGFVLQSASVARLTSPSGNSQEFHDAVRVHVRNHSSSYICSHIISCAGLYADRVARLTSCQSVPMVIPIRGEYLILKPEKRHLVRGNIYPVPDPRMPFLGVHFTPHLDGNIWLGPNAIPAFARQGYYYTTLNREDLWEMISYPGFMRMMAKNADFGLRELFRSIYLPAQVAQLQRYIPTITSSDVIRGPAGVRAIALTKDGELVKDFLFISGEGSGEGRILHVINAPSPAATSSLAIAQIIADRIKSEFSL